MTQDKYGCCFCTVRVPSARTLHDHLRSRHGSAFPVAGQDELTESQRILITSYTPQVTRMCPVIGCFHRDSFASGIQRHVRRHHFDFLFGDLGQYGRNVQLWLKNVLAQCTTHKCTYVGCDCEFRTKPELAAHFSAEHAVVEDTNHRCTLCGRVFKKHHKLKKHMNNCQTVQQAFACDICGASYATKSNLQTHKHYSKTHGIFTHVCPTCGEAVSHPHSFRAHMIKRHDAPKTEWTQADYLKYRVTRADMKTVVPAADPGQAVEE